jgi:hypothetical protein
MSPRIMRVLGRVRSLPIALLAMSLVAVAAPACRGRFEAEPVPVIIGTQPTGQLVVDWTIQLRKDPADCQLSGATSISIHVVTLSGFDAGTFVQACTVFSTSIILNPGQYQASAMLIDVAGAPRTTTVVINPFTIVGNDVFTVPIDFPASSFF